MEKEFWKDIKGFEGIYQVSNYGRVKNIKKEKTLKHFVVCGYYHVGLGRKGVPNKHYFEHRLVAEAFLPNPNNYPIINHKDENKLNNYVHVNPDGSVDQEKSNLEWCTYSYNITYGSRAVVKKTKEEQLEYWRKQYQKNRDYQIEYHRKYYLEHKEEKKEQSRQQYKKKKESQKKIIIL